MADTTRTLTDLFGILGPRKAAESATSDLSVTNVAELSYATKALQKFLVGLQATDNPLLLDLGPVVGSNVTFFGEQLGCRIRVEDIAHDIDKHAKAGTLDQLPEFFAKRFTQEPGTAHDSVYTKYVVVDETTLKYRTYPATRPRQRNLLNGDIIKLFKDLRVTDSFLMKSKVREMLFRKPARR
jgi:hypothetical protein